MAATLVIVLAGAGLGLFVDPGQPSRLEELLPDLPRRSSPTRQLRLLPVVIGLMAAALLAPPLAAAAALWWWAHPRLARRRAALAATRAVESSLPDIVDLLALCTSAGWTLPLSLPLVARRASGPVPDAIVEAMASSGRGRPLADSIADALAPLGERAAALESRARRPPALRHARSDLDSSDWPWSCDCIVGARPNAAPGRFLCGCCCRWSPARCLPSRSSPSFRCWSVR